MFGKIQQLYCIVTIWEGISFTVDVNKPKPNKPNTMSLVEKRTEELGLCEDFVNGRAGSLRSRIVNGVVRGGSKSVLGPRPRMSSSFPILILHHLELSRVSESLASPWDLPGYIFFCSFHLGRLSVDCAGRHLSVCPIPRFPQLAVGCSGQHDTVQGSFLY